MVTPRRTTPWKSTGVASAARPTITAHPPGRTRSMASRRVPTAPTASKARSTPAAPTASRSPSSPAHTSDAPSVRAVARRPSCGSSTATRSAPPSTTAWSTISPIVPAPITTARPVGPASTPARAIRAAWTPLASGSASAPRRGAGPAGSARIPAAGMRRTHPWARNPHQGRDPAGPVYADELPLPGELLDPGDRVIPGDQRVDRRQPVPPPGIDAVAQPHHPPGELVAHDQRRRAVRLLAAVALDLRPADPHRQRRDQHLTRRRLGI